MKSLIKKSILLLSICLLHTYSSAQIGENIKEILFEELRDELPSYLEKELSKEGIFELQKFNVGNKKTTIKGVINIDKITKGFFKDDIRIKSKILYKPNDEIEIKNLKLHLPGDKFLFFRRYRDLLK